ncbi:hypothetical protein D3C81_1485150 [compost metagenome]
MTVQNIVDRLTVFVRTVQLKLIACRKCFRDIPQRDAILRTLRSGQAGFHIGHVQFQ